MSFLDKLKEYKKDAEKERNSLLEVQWPAALTQLDKACKEFLFYNPHATSITIKFDVFAGTVVQDALLTPQGQKTLSAFLGELPFTITGNTLHIVWGEL